jgi:hypothetical protein
VLDRYFEWRAGGFERQARKFNEHPWRAGLIQVPMIGIAIGLGGWLGGGTFASAWHDGLAAAVIWPFVYRFFLGPYYRRKAEL